MSRKPLLTVLLGDPSLGDLTKPDRRYTLDDRAQVVQLQTALEELDEYGFQYWDSHEELLVRLHRERPGQVLNFCDTGYRNVAARELHIPAYLELLEIPYSGTGPVGLGLAYDKSLVRALASAHGIPVPWERFLAAGQAPTPLLSTVPYPAFIKPNRADGSFGISAQSIVADVASAHDCVETLRRDIPGLDIIIQEFLPGQELGVGVIGNPGADFDFLPVLEVDFHHLSPTLPRLLDYGSKTDPDSPYWKGVQFVAAELPENTRLDVDSWSERLFTRLQLRDYARFDFRADRDGKLRLMEVNPNPAWCHDGKLAWMARLAGESYAQLLRRIIEAARARRQGL
jgi:D-alanine-D-alanine ligase